MILFDQQPSKDTLELHLAQPLVATGHDERVVYKSLNSMPLFKNVGALSTSMRLWAADEMQEEEAEVHFSKL